MFWLGLLLTVCFIPGYVGASVPTQWAVLSIILPLGLWRIAPYSPLHKPLFGFLVYAAISGLWSIQYQSWVWGLWVATLWVLAFHWGTLVTNLQSMWKGVACGLWVSTAVAVIQAFGYFPVEAADDQLAGLFFNSSLFGVLCGLTLVALICERLWWYTPPLALGLILSGSRGGFVLLGFGLTARFTSPFFAIGCVGLAVSAAMLSPLDLADSQRLQIWGVTLSSLSPFGHGAGSFVDIFYMAKTGSASKLIHPGYVHNDIIQLTYEFGLAAFLLLIAPAVALAGDARHRVPLLTFWLCACFYFPLYAPLTAFLWLIVAGNAVRDWAVVRDNLHHCGHVLLPWALGPRSRYDLNRREAVPMVAGTSHKEG